MLFRKIQVVFQSAFHRGRECNNDASDFYQVICVLSVRFSSR